MTTLRQLSLHRAELTNAGDEEPFETDVRVIARSGEAYALNTAGRRVWQAAIVAIDKRCSDEWTLELLDPPGFLVTVRKGDCGCHG